ncbi:phosphotransferase family protein [Halobacillus salinus]|uniref:Aminoglycoside phosphotransferase family protein n=1 Tax=Halobacillus salinus TaxID=192814 RepID=A0A4Z0H1G1_9BACI|nr:aminoglycoside phosphotransferase family protein [Halobacillus salinus]TGB03724.1 aminoglycoside phosphotransferase family protein [Halobacillus salinus]
MKAGWERSNAWITPNLETVQQVLNPFLKNEELLSQQVLSGGLNNTNIKITTARERYVLRIYNAQDETMEKERGILKFLKGKVPVPRVLYYGTSESVLEHAFLLLSWVEGEQLSEVIYKDQSSQIEEAAETVGRTLANIHAFKFPGAGLLNGKLQVKQAFETEESSFLAFIEELLFSGYAEKHIGAALCHRVWDFAKTQGHLLNHLENQNTLVHSDFNPLNVLVGEKDGKTAISGVLDWEYAMSGSPLMDIGNMLRYEEVTDPKLMRPFIVGYRKQGGQLPPEWLKKAKLLDLIALCDLLNRETCGENRVNDLKALLLRTVSEWKLFEKVQSKLDEKFMKR